MFCWANRLPKHGMVLRLKTGNPCVVVFALLFRPIYPYAQPLKLPIFHAIPWMDWEKRKIDSCDMNPSFNDFNAKSNPSLFCQQNQTMNKPRTGCVWSCLRWSINHHVSISACEMATPAITEHKHQNVSKKQPIIADVHYIHTYIYTWIPKHIYIYIYKLYIDQK